MQDVGQIIQYSISNLDLRKSILLAPVKIHLLWKMVLSGPHGCIGVALSLEDGKNRLVTFGQRSITATTHTGMFRKTNDNKKGVFMAPTDVISDPCLASPLYVSDIKRKMLYQVKLTNPAMVSEVKCKVTAPTALTFISNCLVVADKCERHIKVVDLRSQLYIKPNTLSRLTLEKLKNFCNLNGIPVKSTTGKPTKTDYVNVIKKYLVSSKYNSCELNIVEYDIGTPTALASFGEDLLCVVDAANKKIHELRVENRGHCLIATGRCVYSYGQSELISSLEISSGGELLITDTNIGGGLLSLNLGIGEKDILFNNNSAHCTQIHSIGLLSDSKLVFTDIGGKRVKFFDIATNQVLGVLGQGTSKSVDGHSGLSCFEPQHLCIQGKTVFLVDGQSLRLITGANPVIFYCKILRSIYQSFNVHKDILGISRDCTIEEALPLLKTTARQLEDMTAQAKEFFHVKGQCQGPQGTPSQKSVKSISHFVEGLRKLKGASNEFDPKLKNVISMKSLTTLSNEYMNGY